jgi:RNase H-fold protein (predicted Holliday junction resolvase)
MAASRYLNETDTRGSKRKGVIDTLSAEIILQNALDKLRFMREREEASLPHPKEDFDA